MKLWQDLQYIWILINIKYTIKIKYRSYLVFLCLLGFLRGLHRQLQEVSVRKVSNLNKEKITLLVRKLSTVAEVGLFSLLVTPELGPSASFFVLLLPTLQSSWILDWSQNPRDRCLSYFSSFHSSGIVSLASCCWKFSIHALQNFPAITLLLLLGSLFSMSLPWLLSRLQ